MMAGGQAPGSTTESRSLDLAVVIVTYNSAADLSGLLDSIAAAAPGLRPRVFVVDNDSTDDTVALARARSDVTVVESGGNLGFSGGINVGRRHAGSYDALAILNPDSRLEPGCLTTLVAALDDPTVGIAVPVLREADGSIFCGLRRRPTVLRAAGESLFGARLAGRPAWLSDTYRRPADYEHAHDVDWASGAILVVSGACDAAAGDWDERFFLYSEETEYALRARRLGFCVRFVPDAVAVHAGGGSGTSPALGALMAVNRVRLFEMAHGRAESLAFRAAVALGHLLRRSDPGHRLALRHVLRRSSWDDLPAAQGPVDRSAGKGS